MRGKRLVCAPCRCRRSLEEESSEITLGRDMTRLTGETQPLIFPRGETDDRGLTLIDSIWPNSSNKLVRSCCVAFLSTCPTHSVVLHTAREHTAKEKQHYLGLRLVGAVEGQPSRNHRLAAEGLGSYGGQPLLLPLLLSLPGAPLARVGPRRLPLAVSGARARPLAVLALP